MRKWVMGAIFLFCNTAMANANFLPDSFSAEFEQEYVSTLKAKPKKGLGAIEYKFPGQIRFETNTPSTVIYVSNGKKAWYYRAPFIEGEEGEVTISNVNESSTLYTKFFDVLRNGLKNNKYYSVENKTEGSALIFSAQAAKDFGIKESYLKFKDLKNKSFSELSVIELTFNDGKKSSLTFKNLKTNNAFKADRFDFVPPANTKIVN